MRTERLQDNSIVQHEGAVQGLYCSVHKQPGTVNVISRKCLQSSCSIIPVFNNEGASYGIYCNRHKQPGMVDVESRSCEEDDCRVRPCFNYDGVTGGGTAAFTNFRAWWTSSAGDVLMTGAGVRLRLMCKAHQGAATVPSTSSLAWWM